MPVDTKKIALKQVHGSIILLFDLLDNRALELSTSISMRDLGSSDISPAQFPPLRMTLLGPLT